LRCSIVGEGPDRPRLEKAIRERGLEGRVVLRGRLGSDAVRALVSRSRVFVLACVDLPGSADPRDGIPVALMEAMALARPVVSTTVAGIPELVQNDANGKLVAPGDAEALAAAVEGLLANDEAAAALGAAARARVEAAFDLRRNVRALASLLAETEDR
jgi:glycosyltransferase involved in cell wall biosynthesis